MLCTPIIYIMNTQVKWPGEVFNKFFVRKLKPYERKNVGNYKYLSNIIFLLNETLNGTFEERSTCVYV